MKYKCQFCDTEFEQSCSYLTGGINPLTKRMNKHKGVGSTQIRCPKCLNLIPSSKIEYTGNIIGAKHIHTRQ